MIGREYLKASAAQAPFFQALGDFVLGAHGQMAYVLTMVFILGALMYYAVLFRSRLVPRWLSGWGLLAAVPYFASAVFGLFGSLSPMSGIEMVLVLPLALQEMVLAVWLIAKGFDRSPVHFQAARAAVSAA